MTTPDLNALILQLGQLAITNTASHVVTRVRAARTGKQHEQQLNELTELINELVDERNQLLSIARAFEQELIAQQISAADIRYITDTLLPALEQVLRDDDGGGVAAATVIDKVKTVLSPEVLTVLQLVGFNYKQAIGEPLTSLIRNLIVAQSSEPSVRAELDVLAAKQNVLMLEIVQDPEASARMRELNS